jgi:hypothetical protein
MERKVKFEPGVDKGLREKVNSAPRMARDGRPPERKSTMDRAAPQSKQKPVIGFEDYLKRKPTKANTKVEQEKNMPLKPPVPRQRIRAEKPATQPVIDKASNLKKISQFKEKPSSREIEQYEKVEMSLENIFDSQFNQDDYKGDSEPDFPAYSPSNGQNMPLENKSMVENRSKVHETVVIHNSSASFPQQRQHVVAASPTSPAKQVIDDGQQGSKNIRGLLKKEIYGDDEARRREAQLRMKKELELQMEANKLKKEHEKRKKDEEEKIENEKFNKYMEREKQKKDEEERRELEIKRKKDLFNVQQAALLEEYKQTSNAEKRSKGGRKSTVTDATTSQGASNPINNATSQSLLNKPIAVANDKMSIQSNFQTNNTTYGQQPNSTNGYPGSIDYHEIKTDSNFGGGTTL